MLFNVVLNKIFPLTMVKISGFHGKIKPLTMIKTTNQTPLNWCCPGEKIPRLCVPMRWAHRHDGWHYPGWHLVSQRRTCGFVWKCWLNPEKPNGFADHYPVFKWLFHWEYTLFSDKPMWTCVFFGCHKAAITQKAWRLPQVTQVVGTGT